MSGRRASVAVIGAGLAGLVAARAAAEAGAEVAIYERAPHPGGTSLLSSGWLWRYRDRAGFRRGAPEGDPALQLALLECLDDDLRWLELQGVELGAAGTNPLTVSRRIDPSQAISALTRGLALRCDTAVASLATDAGTLLVDGSPVDGVILASGGYAGSLDVVREATGVAPAVRSRWVARSAGRSDGTLQRQARGMGAAWAGEAPECYVRALPSGIPDLAPEDWITLSQVYGFHGLVLDANGQRVAQPDHDWADTQVMWQLAVRTGAGAICVAREALDQPTPYGRVGECIERAQRRGGLVWRAGTQHTARDFLVTAEIDPEPALQAMRDADAVAAVAVRCGITHSVDGLRVDPSGRVLDHAGVPLPGMFACGVEAGGVGSGGYCSGLAQALVLGRRAGRAAASP